MWVSVTSIYPDAQAKHLEDISVSFCYLHNQSISNSCSLYIQSIPHTDSPLLTSTATTLVQPTAILWEDYDNNVFIFSYKSSLTQGLKKFSLLISQYLPPPCLNLSKVPIELRTKPRNILSPPWKKLLSPIFSMLSFLKIKPRVVSCEWLNYCAKCISNLAGHPMVKLGHGLRRNRILKIGLGTYEKFPVKLSVPTFCEVFLVEAILTFPPHIKKVCCVFVWRTHNDLS